MKRILGVLFMVMSAGIIYGQQLGSNCAFKNEIKAYVEAATTVGRYLREIKATQPEDQWQDFIGRAEKGDVLGSFNAFGSGAETLRSGYLSRASEMETAVNLCVDKIRAVGGRTNEEIRNKFKTELDCFYADTVLNNLATLIERSGVPQPNLAAGPCETIMERCMRSAESGYNRTAIECAVAGFGGVWGFVSALFCLSVAGDQHFDAIMDCRRSYIRCKDRAAF